MMAFMKSWQKWILDTLLMSTSSFSILVAVVFFVVFSIGYWCGHWIDQIDLSIYKSYSVLSDNIGGETIPSWLTYGLPVDAVYTWVNGSDPLLVKGLEELHKVPFAKRPNCYLLHCFPSPYLSLEIKNGTESIITSIPHLKIVRKLEASGGTNKKFFFILQSPERDKLPYLFQEVKSLLGNDTLLQEAYWIPDSNLEWSVKWKTSAIIKLQAEEDLSIELSKIMPDDHHSVFKFCTISNHEKNYFVQCDETSYLEKLRVAIQSYKDAHKCKYPQYFPASLLLDHRASRDSSSSINRFLEFDELRYSIRSLEKFAPWVRRIFLVTNGQIPHWLNMEHPRLTIVTHDQIFADPSHLPTFSSPAIEANIDRIPGLSENFLYLNDDVLLGSPVWPDDFYAKSTGYKVYLSGHLPECSPGCPGSWIKDGYCDETCNTSSCNWDAGDCDGDIKTATIPDLDNDYGESYHEAEDFCSSSCSNIWIGDSFCDSSCSVASCGFDAGDCGLGVIEENVFEMAFPDKNATVRLPQGVTTSWLNISSIVNGQTKLTLDGSYSHSKGVRAVVANTVYKVLIVVLKANYSSSLRLLLSYSPDHDSNEVPKAESLMDIEVVFNTTFEHKEKIPKKLQIQNESELTVTNFSFIQTGPKIMNLSLYIGDKKNLFINTIDSGLPENLTKAFITLDDKYTNGEFTLKGLQAKKSSLVDSYLQINPEAQLVYYDKEKWNIFAGFSRESNVTNPIGKRKLLHWNPEVSMGIKRNENSLWESLPNYFKLNSVSPDSDLGIFESKGDAGEWYPPSYIDLPGKRRLLDIYGDSMLYVNNLYNTVYGFETRKMISHMPHYINKGIFQEFHQKFEKEFATTSSHKLRQANDLQFSFAYFYFLMGEKLNKTLESIFDKFDTDKSGTWSDREIRTFMVRTNSLPLHYNDILHLHKEIQACNDFIKPLPVRTPPFERYADSDLPTVSKELIVNCKNSTLEKQLRKFMVTPRFDFTLLSDSDVSFKMLSSNLSSAIHVLDDIRKNPKKFICINNDLDPRGSENELMQALLQDTFESLWPMASSFELPPSYRNKFLYTWELQQWKKWRNFIRALIYGCLSVLILFTLATFFSHEIETIKKHFCRRKKRRPLKENV